MAEVKIQAAPPSLIETQAIKIAGTRDLNYLHHLQRKWGKNLGYLNLAALDTLLQSKCAWIINENSQHAGYLLLYPQKQGILKVVQVAIEPELLRTTLGTDLMETMIAAARNASSTTIRLNSRQDLTANLFWPTLGFTHSATSRSKNPQAPLMFEWTINLLSHKPTDFLDDPADLTRFSR